MGKCIVIGRGKFLEVQPKMKNKRDRKPWPLFYIQQPDVTVSEPKMQRSYLFRNEEPENTKTEVVQEEKPIIEKLKEKLVIETAHKDVNGELENHKEVKKGPFNDLSLEEKIKHLKQVPSSVAKVKYEFITVERSYTGYFMEMKKETIVIHSLNPRKKNVNILAGSLVDIRRVGL